jgi:surface antigen
MRKIVSGVCVVALVAPMLAGCAPPGSGPQAAADATCRVFGGQNQVVGAAAGTLLGAALGAALGGGKGAAIGAGSGLVAGGLFGSAIDHRDCEIAQAALRQSLAESMASNANTNSQVTWRDPATNNSGLFNVQPAHTDPQSGRICRAYNSTITKSDGTTSQGTGTTCRDANGDWQVQ